MAEPSAGRRSPVHVQVRVELRPEVEDAEAENVERALALLGVGSLRKVRIARVYDLEFEAVSAEEADRRAHEAVDRLLANPVIHRVTVGPGPG